jgi:hypothetical protein
VDFLCVLLCTCYLSSAVYLNSRGQGHEPCRKGPLFYAQWLILSTVKRCGAGKTHTHKASVKQSVHCGVSLCCKHIVVAHLPNP